MLRALRDTLAVLAIVLIVCVLTGCGPLLRVSRTAPPATPPRPVRSPELDAHLRQAARAVRDICEAHAVPEAPQIDQAARLADALSVWIGEPARPIEVLADTTIYSVAAADLEDALRSDLAGWHRDLLDAERRMESYRSTPGTTSTSTDTPLLRRLAAGGVGTLILLGLVVLIVGAPALGVIAWLWRRAHATYRALREVVAGVEAGKAAVPEPVAEAQKAAYDRAQSPATRKAVAEIRTDL